MFPPRTIRGRLALWLAFLLVVVLSGFGVAVYELQRVSLVGRIDDELGRRAAAISAALRSPPPPGFRGPGPGFGGPRPGPPPHHHDLESRGPDGDPPHPPQSPGPFPPPPHRGERRGPPGPRDFRLSPELLSLFDETRPHPFYFTVWSRDGAPFKRSAHAPLDVPLPERRDRTDTRTHTRTRSGYREAFHYTELSDCVLAGVSLAEEKEALRTFTWWLLAAGGIVLAFGLGGGWWLTTRAIRPIEDISAAASRIAAGDLSERIEVADTHSELGRLARVLNSTFARLDSAFARERQF